MKRAIFAFSLLSLALATAAGADDLSADLDGGGGQGFASLVAEGTTVSYTVLTNGIGTPTRAYIAEGSSSFLELDASFTGGLAVGSVSTSAANVGRLNDETGSFTVRVEGPGGTVAGPLENAGSGGGGSGPGSLGFASATYSVGEGDGTVTIGVTRSGGTDGAVSVGYATAAGSATAGSDYTTAAGTLSWADGEGGTKTFTVDILEDAAEEGAETFTATLTGPTGGATLGTATTTVTITDNEQISCVDSETSRCLADRFLVRVDWQSPPDFPGLRPALVSELGTPDSGIFYFIDPNNLEFLIKSLNGCDITNHYWVFFAATTTVEFTVTVTDTVAGVQKTYSNTLGHAADAITDTSAFDTCP